jgi:hypothetical protein
VAPARLAVTSSFDPKIFAPLLCVVRGPEGPFLFLIGGLLAVILTFSVVSPIGHVDLSIVPLLL